MVRLGRWSTSVVAVVVLLVLSFVLTAPVVGASPGSAGRVRLDAGLTCLAGGGATVTLTIRNEGTETVVLQGDFHLFLEKVVRGGHEGAGVVFVFPAPGFNTVAPGGEVTFQVPIGESIEGEPGSDLSGHRLVLEVEVFLAGRGQPLVRHFVFPGCDA